MSRDPQFKKMLDLFAMLKKGYCDKTKVRIGRLQNLISSSCIGNVCSRIFSRMQYRFHNFIIICHQKLRKTLIVRTRYFFVRYFIYCTVRL